MNDVKIRKAALSDADVVYDFLCRLSEKEHDFSLFKEHYITNLNNDSIIYLVAEIDYKVIGFLSCHGQLLLHHAGWAYEIQEMFTDEMHRGKGVGEQLLNKLEDILSGNTYDILEVTSNNRRVKAHQFYIKNGFSQTHQKFTKKP